MPNSCDPMDCSLPGSSAAAAAAKSASVISDSVRPHRWQPTRLPRPWDSLGKNTGVGCHFLLQCMKVKSESEVARSCPTLSDPMDCSPPGSSVYGIFQARVLEWGAIAFSENQTSSLQIKTNVFLKFWMCLACLWNGHCSKRILLGYGLPH